MNTALIVQVLLILLSMSIDDKKAQAYHRSKTPKKGGSQEKAKWASRRSPKGPYGKIPIITKKKQKAKKKKVAL
jgi:hypothetical protein